MNRTLIKLAVLITFCAGLFYVGCVSAQSSYILHNDLDSAKWINETENVVHNGTLSAYLLMESGIPYADFTEWTEHDAPGRLSETTTRVTFTGLDRGDDVYLYDTKTGELQTFTHAFRFKVTSLVNSATVIRLEPYTVSQSLADYTTNRLAGVTQFGVQLRSWSSSTQYNLLLMETYSGSLYISGDTSNRLNVNTLYYVQVKKTGTSLTLKVDNNADFSSPINSYSLTLHGNWNLPYLMVPQSCGLSGGLTTSGYAEYLDFGTGAGYDPGYLITENLLSNYTGTPFSLIYNVSTPTATAFNVSVSSDLVSWTLTGDHTGDGFLVSYLEPYNWTSLYVKFGFETDGVDTPILYDYHLTFYHEGADGGGIVLEFGDLNWILTVIWLALLGIGWGNNNQPLEVLGAVFGMVVGIYFLAEDTLIGLIVVFFNMVLFVLALRRS